MTGIEINLSFMEAHDLCGQDYFSMLDFAAEICASMSFVIRPSLPLSPTGKAMIDSLHFCLLEESHAESWPGTTLRGEFAFLYRYRYDVIVSNLLKSASGCLFSWMQPDLPEDLCFYRSDGSVWLATISHERDAFISSTPSEIEAIKSKSPGLYACMVL